MALVMVPINAFDAADVQRSLACTEPLRRKGFAIGVMLVPVRGWDGFVGALRAAQLDAFYTTIKANSVHSAIVMAPNLPWCGADWFHDPDTANTRMRTAIDFAAALSSSVGAPCVTFHLNTLLSRSEWEGMGPNFEVRERACNLVFHSTTLPALSSLAAYARMRGVRSYVETTPVPEFGDRPEPELNTLVNPFPLYAGRGFDDVRNAGLGIVLDYCHTQTLYAVAAQFPVLGERFFDYYPGLFPNDIERLRGGSLLDEVRALCDGDIVHCNDGRGYYNPERGQLHEEGVALGAGDIPNLPTLIAMTLRKEVPIVFEINERDYASRPALTASIAYFIAHALRENGGDHDQ